MFNQINMSDPYTFYVFITSFISLFFCFSQGTVVKVSGVLLCNDKPLLNVPVEMWEKDLLDPDDFMAKTVTEMDGSFELQGEESEVFHSIEPYLIVSHNCATGGDNRTNCLFKTIKPIKVEEVDGMMKWENISVDLHTNGEWPSVLESCKTEEELLASELSPADNGTMAAMSSNHNNALEEMPNGTFLNENLGTSEPFEERVFNLTEGLAADLPVHVENNSSSHLISNVPDNDNVNENVNANISVY